MKSCDTDLGTLERLLDPDLPAKLSWLRDARYALEERWLEPSTRTLLAATLARSEAIIANALHTRWRQAADGATDLDNP